MKIRQKDIYNFRLDYIELQGEFVNWDKISIGINETNSDTFSFENFSVLKTTGGINYDSKYIFIYQNKPIYDYYIGKQLNSLAYSKNKFCVKGSAFSFFSSREILDFITINLDVDKLKRIDIACDLLIGIDKASKDLKLYSTVKGVPRFKGNTIHNSETGALETIYLGNKLVQKSAKKKRANPMYFFRVYDKKADIKAKDKFEIMPDYVRQKDVTRIEMVCGSDFCQRLQLSLLYQERFLQGIFNEYISKYTDGFSEIDYAKIKLPTKTLKFSDLTREEVISDKIFNTLLNSSSRMISLGFCPIVQLIKAGKFKNDLDIIEALGYTLDNGVVKRVMIETKQDIKPIKRLYIPSDYAKYKDNEWILPMDNDSEVSKKNSFGA